MSDSGNESAFRTVHMFHAWPVSDHAEAPRITPLVVYFDRPLPHQPGPDYGLALFRQQAVLLADALHTTLPGGTLSALRAELLQRAVNQLRVPDHPPMTRDTPEVPEAPTETSTELEELEVYRTQRAALAPLVAEAAGLPPDMSWACTCSEYDDCPRCTLVKKIGRAYLALVVAETAATWKVL